LPLLALARHGHLPGLNTKALHAQSYGTIRQSTGSQHANKAASMALQFTTLGIKKKDRPGSAFLLHLSPSTQAWPSLVQRLSSRRAMASVQQSTGSLHPPSLPYSLFPTLSSLLSLPYSLLQHLIASEHTQGIHPNVHKLLSLPNWKGSCSSEMVAIPAYARNAF
jgi:hypothetical protein